MLFFTITRSSPPPLHNLPRSSRIRFCFFFIRIHLYPAPRSLALHSCIRDRFYSWTVPRHPCPFFRQADEAIYQITLLSFLFIRVPSLGLPKCHAHTPSYFQALHSCIRGTIAPWIQLPHRVNFSSIRLKRPISGGLRIFPCGIRSQKNILPGTKNKSFVRIFWMGA
jgi:hypothetical protein